MNSEPPPTPTTTPCSSMNCQYLSQRLAIIMPKATQKEPKRNRTLGEPMSKIWTHEMGEAQRRNEFRVPIQAMVKIDKPVRRTWL